MLHFSCDLCACPLDERRYVVRLEVYPAFDPTQLEEADFDVDHLQEVSEMLANLPEGVPSPVTEEGAKVFRFDLCPHCYRKFVRDPLGREALRRLKYSKN